MHTVSGSISLPSPGFFSPFPHGTGSLSVDNEYLALEDGPPMFRQDFTCPALLDSSCQAFVYGAITLYGHPSQDVLLAQTQLNWASPGSLAATAGISVDFFSSGYLDVSVLPVRFRNLCIQLRMTLRSGFPIRISPDNSACYQLSEAFRRFPRPSSPVVAKASTVCTYSLDHTTSSYLESLLSSASSSDNEVFKNHFQLCCSLLLLHFHFSVSVEENISNNVLVFLSYSI